MQCNKINSVYSVILIEDLEGESTLMLSLSEHSGKRRVTAE